MLPVIRDGEILHVEPVPPGKLRVGDIVLFTDGTQLKAHRIVRRKRNLFRTRGDAGLEMDNAIRGQQIMGRIVAKEGAESGGVISLKGRRVRLTFLAREVARTLSRRVRGAFLQSACSPLIEDGEILHVQRAYLPKLRVGDIVLFRKVQNARPTESSGRRKTCSLPAETRVGKQTAQ